MHALKRFHAAEALRRTFSSSERQMGILDPFIEPAAHLAAVLVAEFFIAAG